MAPGKKWSAFVLQGRQCVTPSCIELQSQTSTSTAPSRSVGRSKLSRNWLAEPGALERAIALGAGASVAAHEAHGSPAPVAAEEAPES